MSVLDSGQVGAHSIPLSVVHKKLQFLIADFDGGMEIGYADFADLVLSLAFLSKPVTISTNGDIENINSLIWDRIVAKSSFLSL